MKGIVTKSTGSWYSVRTEEGIQYDCRIPGRFRMKGIKSTNPVAVGDKVSFNLEQDKKTGVIQEIHDRLNYIVRKSVNLSKQTHIIAANIDIAFLLVTIDNPPTSTGFIDRFLATAEAYSIPVILLFNKVDIYTEEDRIVNEELTAVYTEIGYECIDVSATTGHNIEHVKTIMKDKVSMFSGHSGVGKSTMINAVEEGLNLKTGEVSKQHKQGIHTTTFAEMFTLSFGGYIIDTPGIKGFGVVAFSKEEIGDYFPEIFKIKGGCKFNNCIHVNEPHCVVKDAVGAGDISESRYTSYLQLLDDEEQHYRVDIYN